MSILKKVYTWSGLVIGAFCLSIAIVTTTSAAASALSSDPLPTVQVDGIVLAQAIYGNTVYATGCFNRAIDVPGGVGTVVRRNLLAYDITTGRLIPGFDHPLSDVDQACTDANVDAPKQGRAIAVSPDGKKLFVGGNFVATQKVPRNNFAVFNITTAAGSLLSGYGPVNNKVRAIAASNSRVYIGGSFSNVAGQSKSRLAAFELSNGGLASWNAPAPNTDSVRALVMTPDGTKVVVGGAFSSIGTRSYPGFGALSAVTGEPQVWAEKSKYPINTSGPEGQTSISSLSTDGKYIFLTAFQNALFTPGTFEGRAAVRPTDGSLVWLNDCHGDSYSSYPINGVLFSASHAHDCSQIDTYMEGQPTTAMKDHQALAETTEPSGVNLAPYYTNYTNYAGQPRSTQLYWYPNFLAGNKSGASQAAWSVTGNSSFVSYGGEFLKVNYVNQVGLVRFSLKPDAARTYGPFSYSDPAVISTGTPADGTGHVMVSWPTTWDRDDQVLNYTLFRVDAQGAMTQLTTISADSKFWVKRTVGYLDTGVKPASYTYKVKVTDANGNAAATMATTRPTSSCNQLFGTASTLCAGEMLTSEQSLFSRNGAYQAIMQADGNFVVYRQGVGPTWYSCSQALNPGSFYNAGYSCSNMPRHPKFTLQADGNLVMYNYIMSVPLWASATQTTQNPGTRLIMQDDGNLVLYTNSYQPVWYRPIPKK